MSPAGGIAGRHMQQTPRRATSGVRALVFLLSWLLCAAPVRAQDPATPETPTEISLAILAAAETGPSGTTFVVRGSTDLPDHARVTLVIWYSKTPIYRSWRRADVQGGRFQVTVGPIRETVLAGSYEAVAHFVKTDQPAQLRRMLKTFRDRAEARASFYVGTPEQEAEEDALYREFLPPTVRKLEMLYDDLVKHTAGWLHGSEKFTKDDFYSWAEALVARLGELRRAMDDHAEARLFASRNPEMVRDISVVLSILDLLATQSCQEIGRKHGVEEGLPDACRAEPVFRIVPAEYRLEVERRFRELARRERSADEATAFDLYQDLLELNELRLQLGRSQQVHKEHLDPTEWERWHGSWLLRLRRAREGAARYTGRNLAGDLAADEDLATLVDDMVELGWMYFSALYATQGTALPEGSPRVSGDPKAQDEKIRARWAKLFEVVQIQRKRLHGRLRDAFQQVDAETPRIREAREKYEKKKIAEAEWLRETEQFGTRLAGARSAMQSLKAEPLLERFFPGTAGRMLTWVECQGRLLAEYRELDSSGNENGLRALHESRLRYVEKVLQQVRNGVEKDLNRKDELIQ